MSDAAADGAAVAHLHVGDGGGGLRQQRALLFEQLGIFDLSMGDEGADDQVIAFFGDRIETGNAADVEDVSGFR